MTLPRITRLTSPPVVGKFYLVPTVHYPWGWDTRPWPVFLPRHEDKEHLNFKHYHYHVDPRFLDKKGWAQAMRHGWNRGADDDSTAFAGVQAAPLCNLDRPLHPHVVWKRMKCRRSDVPYQFSTQIAEKLTPAYIDRQCRSSKSGWICPHKRYPLGSIVAVDGVLTCPLHGLQIDETTGKVIGPQVCA